MKFALTIVLVMAVLWPHLPQFEGDGHAGWRAITYPISVLLVPAGWVVIGSRRATGYPYALDVLLPFPLLIDAAAPTLYHRIHWWDKLMHVVSWSALVAASVVLFSLLGLRRAAGAALAIVVALLTAVLWESWEYLVWIRDSPDLMKDEYSDTVGDLICDLAATVAATVLTLLLAARREQLRSSRVRVSPPPAPSRAGP